MSNTHNRMIVFASILGAILATSILALNPSTITNAQAMPYGSGDYDDRYFYGDQYGYDSNYYYQDDNRYSYDKKDSKSSHGDIQKIKCVNSNINVNGIDITEIPEDTTSTAEANEQAGPDAANAQNGNGLADRINFEKNLVNICVNVNDNEQVKVTPPPPEEEETCEDCFTDNLNSEQEQFLLANSGLGGDTFAEICQTLQENPDGPTETGTVANTLRGLPGITPEQVTSTVDCLVGVGVLEPIEICNNGMDDDDDDMIDCQDPDCALTPICL